MLGDSNQYFIKKLSLLIIIRPFYYDY